MSGLFRDNSLHEQTVPWVVRYHNLAVTALGKHALAGIQSEVGITLPFIGTMADEAVFREDGSDVAVKLYRRGMSIFP